MGHDLVTVRTTLADDWRMIGGRLARQMREMHQDDFM
jgi:hypothetical protein